MFRKKVGTIQLNSDNLHIHQVNVHADVLYLPKQNLRLDVDRPEIYIYKNYHILYVCIFIPRSPDNLEKKHQTQTRITGSTTEEEVQLNRKY